MKILVIGSALREICGDQSALGLTFLEPARTAPKYRLYSFSDAFAALVRDDEVGVSVAGELVEVPRERLQEILASEPPGVVQAPVELEDGRVVLAAFAEPDAITDDVREITEFADFAAYLRAHRSGDA